MLQSRTLPVLAKAEALLKGLGAVRKASLFQVAVNILAGTLRRIFAPPSPTPDPEIEVVSAWDPDIMDPVTAAENVRTLLTDVMRRAAHDWVLYRTSRRTDQRELAHDAYIWLFVEGPGHPNWELRQREDKAFTSFISICEVIGVDPDYARQRIRRLTTRDVKMAGRPAERRHRKSMDDSYYVEHHVDGGYHYEI